MAQARAGFWPSVGVSAARQRGSTDGGPTRTTDSAGISANWDLDIWGQIRRTTESNRASAQASAAALAAARLSAQAALATDYFELRAQDQLQRLLDDTVVAEQLSLKIAESRYNFGVAARADVVSAQAQLLSSQAQQVNAKIQRAILEHAIAVLIGQQPAVVFPESLVHANGCADGARRSSFHPARTPARCGGGRAQGRGGQCADRRGEVGVSFRA